METKLIYNEGEWANRKRSFVCSWEPQFIVLLCPGAPLNSSGQATYVPCSGDRTWPGRSQKSPSVWGHESHSLMRRLSRMEQFFRSFSWSPTRNLSTISCKSGIFAEDLIQRALEQVRLGLISQQLHSTTMREMPSCPFMLAPSPTPQGDGNDGSLILEDGLLSPSALPSKLIRKP